MPSRTIHTSFGERWREIFHNSSVVVLLQVDGNGDDDDEDVCGRRMGNTVNKLRAIIFRATARFFILSQEHTATAERSTAHSCNENPIQIIEPFFSRASFIRSGSY
jgi:hypothetical protein